MKKTDKLVDLIAKFGYVSQSFLFNFFSDRSSKEIQQELKRLVKAEILFTVEISYCQEVLYFVRPKGVLWKKRVQSLDFRLITHHLWVLQTLLYLRDLKKLENFMSEKEMARSPFSICRFRRPDLLLLEENVETTEALESKCVVAVEVELSPKTDRQLNEMIDSLLANQEIRECYIVVNEKTSKKIASKIEPYPHFFKMIQGAKIWR